jgi:hypothetical protein
MDLESDRQSSSICVCNRSFAQPGGLAYHQCSCKKAKARLAGALTKAKDAWTERKRRRLEAAQVERRKSPQPEGTVDVTLDVANVVVHIFLSVI